MYYLLGVVAFIVFIVWYRRNPKAAPKQHSKHSIWEVLDLDNQDNKDLKEQCCALVAPKNTSDAEKLLKERNINETLNQNTFLFLTIYKSSESTALVLPALLKYDLKQLNAMPKNNVANFQSLFAAIERGRNNALHFAIDSLKQCLEGYCLKTRSKSVNRVINIIKKLLAHDLALKKQIGDSYNSLASEQAAGKNPLHLAAEAGTYHPKVAADTIALFLQHDKTLLEKSANKATYKSFVTANVKKGARGQQSALHLVIQNLSLFIRDSHHYSNLKEEEEDLGYFSAIIEAILAHDLYLKEQIGNHHNSIAFEKEIWTPIKNKKWDSYNGNALQHALEELCYRLYKYNSSDKFDETPKPSPARRKKEIACFTGIIKQLLAHDLALKKHKGDDYTSLAAEEFRSYSDSNEKRNTFHLAVKLVLTPEVAKDVIKIFLQHDKTLLEKSADKAHYQSPSAAKITYQKNSPNGQHPQSNGLYIVLRKLYKYNRSDKFDETPKPSPARRKKEIACFTGIIKQLLAHDLYLAEKIGSSYNSITAEEYRAPYDKVESKNALYYAIKMAKIKLEEAMPIIDLLLDHDLALQKVIGAGYQSLATAKHYNNQTMQAFAANLLPKTPKITTGLKEHLRKVEAFQKANQR